MPVSAEKYQELINREMRRYRNSGTGGESVRDKAVRAANIAAGYGNSTALKYPAKAGGGGRSMSRDGDDTKAAAGPSGGGGGSSGKGTGGGKKPGVARRPDVGPDPGGPPGRLSPENAGPGTGAPVNNRPGRLSDEYSPNPRPDYGPPGRLSDEFAGPPPLFPMAVVLPPYSMVRPGETPGGMPGRGYEMEPGRAVVNPPVIPRETLPGRPADFDDRGDLPYSRLPDRFADQPAGPGSVGLPGEPYAPFAGQNQSPSGVASLLQGLLGGMGRAGRAVAPWLSDTMFGR